MMQKAVVERYFDGFRRSDHQQILECLTDDVVWELPGFKHLTGKAAFDGEIENDNFVGPPQLVVEQLIEGGDAVVALGEGTATQRSGAVFRFAFCDVFTFAAERIRRVQSYVVPLTSESDTGVVPIQLNHTIVPARDGEQSARWLADLFGMPEPTRFGPFWQVATANGVDLDFDTYGDDGSFTLQHYAFLVGEDEFDAVFARLLERGMDHWADPGRQHPGEINHHDGGRGVYFLSNDDHLLEIITRPYGG